MVAGFIPNTKIPRFDGAGTCELADDVARLEVHRLGGVCRGVRDQAPTDAWLVRVAPIGRMTRPFAVGSRDRACTPVATWVTPNTSAMADRRPPRRGLCLLRAPAVQDDLLLHLDVGPFERLDDDVDERANHAVAEGFALERGADGRFGAFARARKRDGDRHVAAGLVLTH